MKKKTILSGATVIILLVVTLLNFISADCVGKNEELNTLNPLIEVGDKIYVQHDAENKDVYDLKKSGTGTTTVYEVIIPNFTAGKAWKTTGEFVDNWIPHPVNTETLTPMGATAPEDYISVKAGEEYFIRAYGIGYAGKYEDGSFMPYCAPVLFFNDKNELICDMLTNTLGATKNGVTITVPEGATRMHLSNYNNQNFTIQKVLYLTDKEFDNLPINRTDLEKEINEKYAAYQEDKTVYRNPEKACITFVNDDTWGSIDEFSEMFIEKDIPLVLATLPELLIENASSQKETRLDVARRVEAAGGEIIAHNGGVLTQEGFSDYNTMYSFFVRTKQMFNYYGFDVNGIILAGGQGQVTGAAESERWATSFYSYSDLYGVPYDKVGIALDSAYYHYRTGLGNFKSDYDKIISKIDEAIEKKQWLVFYFHSYSEIDKDVLAKVLDYVNSKSEQELDVVTYKEMYEKNAVKESELINGKTTYYVSSTGTSDIGTSADAPMSYETAKNKTYLSGDTILFKKGDTFYGTFEPKIVQIDDKITKVSSYGTGEMPTISGYKIVSSASAWQVSNNGIYKINLTDTGCFSGLQTTDGNSTNIGFLEDANGQKYFNKVGTLEEVVNEYDFYCDGTYLYIKSGKNPYEALGELKLATKTNLFIVTSNMKVEKMKLCGTGAHGFLNSEVSVQNVQISNNVIENIGGSYLKGTTRYGNGIEFYGTNVSNLVVRDNIIRNVYDVGFTIQGNAGSGRNVVVRNNVFVQNSHDSEIWESGAATGIESYEFTKNLSVNVGRGWGHDARPDKYDVTHILFWGYSIENTDIYFHHNTVYNPRRLYFIEQTNKTDVFFKEKDLIRSDYNTYLMAEDSLIYRHMYKVAEKDTFISEFNKDVNSTFTLIEVDDSLVNVAVTSDDIKEIRKSFSIEEEPEEEEEEEVTTEEMTTEEVTTEETEEVTTEEVTTEEVTTEEVTTEELTTQTNTTASQESEEYRPIVNPDKKEESNSLTTSNKTNNNNTTTTKKWETLTYDDITPNKNTNETNEVVDETVQENITASNTDQDAINELRNDILAEVDKTQNTSEQISQEEEETEPVQNHGAKEEVTKEQTKEKTSFWNIKLPFLNIKVKTAAAVAGVALSGGIAGIWIIKRRKKVW